MLSGIGELFFAGVLRQICKKGPNGSNSSRIDQSRCKTLQSLIHKDINAIWKKEELPQKNK
jgi:hypothetical protein